MNAVIHPEVRIGHVHLTVSNLERAVEFYRDALGLNSRSDTARARRFFRLVATITTLV